MSVALCTFNSERFLERQLRSICCQSTPVDEIVISDDGSTDRTRVIVERFAAHRDDSVVLPWERAGGVVENFERALRAATGDVIVLCDHDDEWESAKVATLAQALDSGAPHMVFTDATLIDAAGEPTGLTLFASLRVSARERRLVSRGEALTVLVRRNIVTGATAAVTKTLVERALPFPTTWLHDEWLAAVAAIDGTLSLIDEPLTRYRVHEANQVGVGSPSVRARWGRMLASSPDRFAAAHARFVALQSKARELGADDSVLAVLESKVRFEASRMAYPRRRWARFGAIARGLATRGYQRWSSQGVADAVRDLVVR